MAYPLSKRSLLPRLYTMELHLEKLEARCLLSGDPVLDNAESDGPMIDPQVYDPTSIMVRFRPEAAAAALADMPRAFQAAGRGFSLLPGLHEVRIPGDMSVVEALQVYQSDNRVLYDWFIDNVTALE